MRRLAPIAVLFTLTAALPRRADAAPPLAGIPADPPTIAAAPTTWDDLPLLHARRLRFGAAVGMHHQMLRNPGGNALGIGASLTFERRRDEAALSAWYFGGIAAESASGRNTGLGHGAVRAVYRIVPVPGALRVMLEAGLQGGYDRAWAYCVESDCRYVPGHLSGAAVLGTVLQLRGAQTQFALGFDLLAGGPRPPGPIRTVPLAFQFWLESGFGGVPW